MTTPSRLGRTSSIVAIVSTLVGTILAYLTLAASVNWPPFHKEGSSPAKPGDPTVVVLKGENAQRSDCTDVSCAFVSVQLKGFPAGAVVHCTFDSSAGSEVFAGLDAKVDTTGAVTAQSTNFFGRRGGWVSATCDGVRGEINPW